jgi:hypothetical protein
MCSETLMNEHAMKSHSDAKLGKHGERNAHEEITPRKMTLESQNNRCDRSQTGQNNQHQEI